MKHLSMRYIRIASLLLMLLAPFVAKGQERENIVVDYNNPRQYD